MASVQGQGQPAPGGHHQRSKSSVLRSFMMHRRNNSQGDGLVSAATAARASEATAIATKPLGGGPLEETSHNRQQPSPEKHIMAHATAIGAPSSPTKSKKLAGELTPIPTGILDAGDINNENSPVPGPPLSPTKRNKTRSTANIVGLLSRPKSFKNLRGAAKDAEAEADEEEKDRGRGRNRSDEKKREKSRRNVKDVCYFDSRTPSYPSPAATPSNSAAEPQVTPIYAQFCSTSKALGKVDLTTSGTHKSPLTNSSTPTDRQWSSVKPRPKSYHPSSATASNSSTSTTPTLGTMSASDSSMDPKDIDAQLEALLDRRNIPEHQRYKMRSLANAIKMELIRQDWAEERSKRQQQQPQPDRPGSHGSARSATGTRSSADGANTSSTAVDDGSSGKASKSKHSRVKSLTLSKVTRGRSRDVGGNTDSTKRTKSPGAPLKKRAEGTLSRHLRSKSTENFAHVSATGSTNSPDSTTAGSGGAGGAIVGFFKAKGPQHNSPADFVTYLRTVQAPEKVEVGKLHKLRLILRNETVDWIEDFIGHGGMEEVVGLLHRIMAVEWREEHEDALLHENLLCLKALCTTALALQYLHSIHTTLFPALVHMIFDPEKKGPSEFTTRSIVTWVLFTYIQTAPANERSERAQTVLGYLRDPEREEDERPVSFVLEMHKDRPYRVWCKEVVSVTKEVFWIFLHHLNVVSLPAATGKERKPVAIDAPIESELSFRVQAKTAQAESVHTPPPPPKHLDPASSYMLRHFPQERPPVPAAPYVGGVEWEATNYLASHLDLVNAIIACTPTAAERTNLRSQMQMSGWERCMGSSLRLCKEKFYGAVHDGLRVWVAAAYEDGWDVRDVRYGPPPPAAERRSNSPSKKANIVGGSKADEAAPKLEIPKLDFILD